jgi:hemolysin-activating ACP:hemolysin acyltransferase
VDQSCQKTEAERAFAKALQEAGKHAEALSVLERASKTSPRDPYLFLYAVPSMLALGRNDAALAAADKARGLAPTLLEAHLAYAEAASGLGALEQADDAFQAAIDLAPNSSDAWFRRAIATNRTGDLAKAKDYLEEALRLDPYNSDAQSQRDEWLAQPSYSAWRPTSEAAALGLAVEYLSVKPAFAALSFGDWSRTLFWQAVRKHYIFVVDAERRIAGFLGWALTDAALAEQWLEGRQALANDECLEGDSVIINAWAADGPLAQSFLLKAAANLFGGCRNCYFKRHYPGGRERAICLKIPTHRRRS